MKKIILTIVICLFFTACDKNVINPVEISLESNYDPEIDNPLTSTESDYDIESNNWYEITYSDTYIWNDYMPAVDMKPYAFSKCKCFIEISFSYDNMQSIYISAFLTANSLGKNPVAVHTGNISYSAFKDGIFKYEFHPEKYRLEDGEEYEMKIIVQIDDNEQTIINTGFVDTSY